MAGESTLGRQATRQECSFSGRCKCFKYPLPFKGLLHPRFGQSEIKGFENHVVSSTRGCACCQLCDSLASPVYGLGRKCQSVRILEVIFCSFGVLGTF